MAINFGTPTQPVDSQTSENTQQISNITLDLNKSVEKGFSLDLTKQCSNLNNILVGLGWDSADNETYDLDLAVVFKRNHVLQSANDVIFFNNKTVESFSLDKDNRTGAGEGDDEKIKGSLASLSNDITDMYFIASIFEASQKGVTFGKIRNAYLRVVNLDNNSEEICNCILKENFSTETYVIPAKLSKNNGSWVFENIEFGGVGTLNDALNNIVNNTI